VHVRSGVQWGVDRIVVVVPLQGRHLSNFAGGRPAAGSKSVLSESNYWQSCIIHGFPIIYKKTYNTTTQNWFVGGVREVCDLGSGVWDSFLHFLLWVVRYVATESNRMELEGRPLC